MKSFLLPMIINSGCVDRLRNFKFLGTLVSSRLTWSANMATVARKCWQHLHFLRLQEKSSAIQSCRQPFSAPSWQGIACEPRNSARMLCNTRERRSREALNTSTEDPWLCSVLPGRQSVKPSCISSRFEDL